MENLQSKRVYFDAEDRPPPSYWHAEIQQPTNNNFKMPNENGNIPSSIQLKTKIDPKEWLKAPEFVPRSKQILNESLPCNGMQLANNLSLNSPINKIVLPDNIIKQHVQAQAHAAVAAAAVAAGAPFSSVRTVIDMPQPILPTQNMVPFAIGQPAPYFMPTAAAPPAPAPPPPPPPPPPAPTMIRFPIPPISQTALALRDALGMVPPGYSANITHINSGIGPPIPAVILKKKRRKRHRRLKANLASAIEKANATSFCSGSEVSERESTQPQLQAASSEPNLNKNSFSEHPSIEASNSEVHPLCGSCPDLSDSQLLLWDNYLFDTIVGEANNMANDDTVKRPQSDDVMHRSEYEIASRPVLAAMDSALHADGICSKQVRQLDRLLQGDGSMEDSLSEDGLVERLRDGLENRFLDSPASTTKSLKAEFEELSFRPTISQYGYPQANFSHVQVATFNPEYNTTSSSILKPKQVNHVEEDCFEGLHIRLNAFDDGDEFALSDSELPQLSRFQQLQWAIQQNTKYYTRLAIPENMCCNIM